MQVVPRWRNVLIFKNTIIQSSTTTATASSTSQLASFHSTPTCYEKWKNKWNSDLSQGQQPSKNYIRYATRQKRADGKRALKDLLFNIGSSKMTFEEFLKKNDTRNWDAELGDQSDAPDKKGRSKSFSRGSSKAQDKRKKRKFRRESFIEDCDEHPERIFQATFGNRWYTWSSKSWEESSFQNSTHGFDWREHSNWTNSRTKEWDTTCGTESDDESYLVGSCSDRTILGLPPKGPLKMEDVKIAFRLSALKWHPDKHQGSSQAMAEEKFKHCVNAYKSLCHALSTV